MTSIRVSLTLLFILTLGLVCRSRQPNRRRRPPADIEGQLNTAVGVTALFDNTGDENTATGSAPLTTTPRAPATSPWGGGPGSM